MGVPLTDLAAIRSVTTREPELVLISALNTWFSSVLGSETFHADVHAGQSGIARRDSRESKDLVRVRRGVGMCNGGGVCSLNAHLGPRHLVFLSAG